MGSLVYILYMCGLTGNISALCINFLCDIFFKLFLIVLVYMCCVSMTYSTSYWHMTTLWIQGM
jgi:hypothetical protein